MQLLEYINEIIRQVLYIYLCYGLLELFNLVTRIIFYEQCELDNWIIRTRVMLVFFKRRTINIFLWISISLRLVSFFWAVHNLLTDLPNPKSRIRLCKKLAISWHVWDCMVMYENISTTMLSPLEIVLSLLKGDCTFDPTLLL